MKTIIALAFLLCGCALAPTHSDRDSVSIEYDSVTRTKADAQQMADAECGKFKRHAVWETDWSPRELGLSGATFRCID